jgi:hypothetical protein
MFRITFPKGPEKIADLESQAATIGQAKEEANHRTGGNIRDYSVFIFRVETGPITERLVSWRLSLGNRAGQTTNNSSPVWLHCRGKHQRHRAGSLALAQCSSNQSTRNGDPMFRITVNPDTPDAYSCVLSGADLDGCKRWALKMFGGHARENALSIQHGDQKDDTQIVFRIAPGESQWVDVHLA